MQRLDTADEARCHAARQAALVDLTQRAVSEDPLGELFDIAVAAMAAGLPAHGGAIFAPGDDGDLMACTSVGLAPRVVDSLDVCLPGDSQIDYTLARREAVVTADLRVEDRFTPLPQLLQVGAVSALSARLEVLGRPHGVLVAYRVHPGSFAVGEIDFVHAVAKILALAVEHRRLVATEDQLAQRERLIAMGERSARLAHDLNNIMSVISVHAELLEVDQALDDSGRAHLAAIRDQAERGSSVIWQVLDFAHRRPLTPEPVDVAAFLHELLPVVRRVLPEGVAVAVRHEGGPHVVSADVTRLQQILMNLVTNARDALGASGQLAIALSRDGDGEDGTGACMVRIDVADSGCGIAPHILPRVFEPFVTTKAPGEGTGLGLAQVHRLVSQHGGHVEIVSSASQGTTVSVWLPAYRLEPSVEATQSRGARRE